jgi:hypothetical protein
MSEGRNQGAGDGGGHPVAHKKATTATAIIIPRTVNRTRGTRTAWSCKISPLPHPFQHCPHHL